MITSVLAILLSISPILGQSLSFRSSRIDAPIGVGVPTSLAVADFDGDQRLDIAVGNSVSGEVSVLLGAGTGAFPAKQGPVVVDGQPPFSLFSQPVLRMAAGDFDRDGRPDLAAVASHSSAVTILRNQGGGEFQRTTRIPLPSPAVFIIAADFNQDDKLDLAVATPGSNTIFVLLANGDGTFGPPVSYPAGSAPSSLVLGDLDGDLRPDLVVVSPIANPGVAFLVWLLVRFIRCPRMTIHHSVRPESQVKSARPRKILYGGARSPSIAVFCQIEIASVNG